MDTRGHRHSLRDLDETALDRLRTLTADPAAEFRPDQLEAISDLVERPRARALRPAHRLGQVRRLLRGDLAAARAPAPARR